MSLKTVQQCGCIVIQFVMKTLLSGLWILETK